MQNSIRFYREKKGLTQPQLADELGMHYTNFNKLENGKSDPPVSRFHEIAVILDTTASALLAPPPSENLSEAERRQHEITSLTSELDPSDWDALLRMVRGLRAGAQHAPQSNPEPVAGETPTVRTKGRKARA